MKKKSTKEKTNKSRDNKVTKKQYNELDEKVRNLNVELYNIKENNKALKNGAIVVALIIIIGLFFYWLNLPENIFLKDDLTTLVSYGAMLVVNVGFTIYYLPKMIDSISTDFGLFLSHFFMWFMFAGAWFLIYLMAIFVW